MLLSLLKEEKEAEEVIKGIQRGREGSASLWILKPMNDYANL